MPLQHVSQNHSNGCFTACLAMLLGKTYDETHMLLHPNSSPNDWDSPGLKSNDVAKAATEVLEKFGFKVQKCKYKYLRSLVKYSRKNVLLIIRWRWSAVTPTEDDPELCHAVVFDAETKQFLDPCNPNYVNLRSFQRQLDSMFYVELPKVTPTRRKENEQGRIQQGNQGTALNPARARNRSRQADRVASAHC